MAKTNIRSRVRMGVLSTLLALAAFSFFAFGSASAHSVSHATRLANSDGGTLTSVQIRQTTIGPVFSPNKITVEAGASVSIVNDTQKQLTLVGTTAQVLVLNPGAAGTIATSQPGQLQVSIKSTGTTLTITVVA